MTSNKRYVLEWEKQPDSKEFDLKVTPHDNAVEALEQAKNSTADQHCISSLNPLETQNEGQ